MFDRNASASASLTPLGLSVAGAFSGLVSRCLVAPLDVLKIRFQVQAGLNNVGTVSRYMGILQATNSIVREEGARALWRGNGVALVLYGAYMAVQFPAYSAIRASASSRLGFCERDASIVAGAVAGAVATALTYPLDWARTRRAATPRGALPLAFPRHWFAPFAGLSAALAGVIPTGAVTFGFYEGARGTWDVSAPRLLAFLSSVGFDDGILNAYMLDAARAPLCGGVAGVAAKALTYPLDTAKKRLQMGGIAGLETPQLRGPYAVLRNIAAMDGLRGWYRGMWPALVKSALTTAFIFGFFDVAASFLASTRLVSLVLPRQCNTTADSATV